MPCIDQSSYRKRPFWMFNQHIETVYPSMFRRVKGVTYWRERMELSDGDFLDLDWLHQQSQKLLIISHGLEGNSERHYCAGMAKYFHARGWDVLAWNCRSCTEINRLPRFYHHGATEDLDAVIQYALTKKYSTIAFVGFSLGGNLTLKWLGENSIIPWPIKAAVTFSVPCDLQGCATKLDRPENKIYRTQFLSKLEVKIRLKEKIFPTQFSSSNFSAIKTFEQFDNLYTAPLHGFKNAHDYYAQCGSGKYLASIRIPTLLVNALHDPFLTDGSFPYTLAQHHPYLTLETPRYGGHVGFTISDKEENWMEIRAWEFVQSMSD